MKQMSLTLASLISCTAMIASARADLIVTTWTGPNNGNWHSAVNWTGGVPNNGGNTFHAVIDSNSKFNNNVVLNANATIDMLTINIGDQLSFPNDIDLAILVGPVVNDGVISMNSNGNGTDLRLGSGITFTGSGVLALSNHINNFVRNNFGPVTRFVNDSNHTVRGSGQFGLDTIFLTNHGLFDANQPTVLQLDLRNEDVNINTGTLQASTGGTLNLLNTASIDNTTGVIRALDASIVNIIGTGIVGGTLTTQGSGVIHPSTNVPSFENILLTGLLRFNNDHDAVFINSITNNGRIELNSIGNGTDIRLHTNPTTFTGAGEIALSNHFNNFLRNNFGGVNRLVNDVDHTIHGAGQLGLDSLYLTNNGLIDANLPTVLQLDLRNEESNFNNGILQASNGGTLNLLNTALIDNTNGLIQALENSVVNVMGTGISGGEMHTEGTGVIRPSTNVPYFEDIVFTGLFQFLNDHDAVFVNTFTNNGRIELNSLGNSTDIRLHTNPTTFTGTGEIALSNHFNNILRNNFGGVNRLVNDVDHTIHGAGQLGVDTLFLTNNGLIDSNHPNTLQLDLRNEESNFNNGVIQASNGGTLNLLNTPLIDNTNGLIQALDSSIVNVINTGIVGGELHTEGTGVIRPSTNVPYFEDILLTGLFQFSNDLDAAFAGTITNNGRIELNSLGNGTEVRIHSSVVTIAGSGELVMSDHPANYIRNNFGAVTQLVNGPDHTIRGAGQIGLDTIDIVNHGTIIANQTNGMTIDQRDSFDNQGLLHVTGTGSMSIWHGPFTTSGTVLIDASRTLTRQTNYVQTAGTTTVNGALTLQSAGILQLQGGILNGVGNITGPVSNTGGSVEPGNSAGILTVTGAYTQGNAGKLRIEIGGLTPGTEHDRLTVTGAATLAGTIEIVLADKYQPSVGDTFTVLTAGTLNGQFRAVDAPSGMGVIYQGNTVVVNVIQTPCAADVTFDGLVNANDLLAVINGWGACTNNPCPPSCVADVTNDCVVNANDLLAVINNWGACQ